MEKIIESRINSNVGLPPKAVDTYNNNLGLYINDNSYKEFNPKTS